MSHQYSLKTFLRQVRGSMLNQCLRRRGIVDLDLDIEVIKPAIVDEMFGKLQALPPDQLRLLETDFAAIAELSSAEGSEAIAREARHRGLDFEPMFSYTRNGYERACWTFLKHPDIIELAACFQSMDRFGAGRWSRRYVGAGLSPATDAAALAQLAKLMRQSYAREGRAHHCHIDHYLRPEPQRHCFFAYPEDHARAELEYDEGGLLGYQSRKGAFEVIVVYQPESGLLEVLAPGGQERVEDLAACFCISILGLPELPPKVIPRLFDLEVLKQPQVDFPTDPADGIEQVQVREVRLGLPRDGGWHTRITFAADQKAYDHVTVHQKIVETVKQADVSMDDVAVTHAKFTMVFASAEGRRAKRLTFEVSLPDRCTLKDGSHDHIARRCLGVWGIAVDPHASRAAARLRQLQGYAAQLRRRA